MKLKVLIILIALTGSYGKEDDDIKSKAHTFYDQRQTGKYNLNVNIKDVQVFSVEDSLASIGDYGSYDDYGGDYDLVGGGDEDYNLSHLTVNPIFAFLGKPTKPSTTTTSTSTTEKASNETSSTLAPAVENKDETTVLGQKEQSPMIVEITPTATTGKVDATTISAITKSKTPSLTVIDKIEYDEIPVEVLYYRANQQQQQKHKKPFVNANNRRKFKRRHPSVQVIDGEKNNVRVVESDQPTVKICGRGEFRDNLGRCRLRAQRKSNHGLGKIFKLFKAFIPKDDLA